MTERAGAVQAAHDQLAEYGLEIEQVDTSGVLQRVRHRDDKPGKRDGWYVAHELATAGGRVLVVGVYGWHRDGGCPEKGFRLKSSGQGLSGAERQELQRRRREAEQAARAARRKKAAEAARRAGEIWDKLPELGGSEYLKRKQVRAFGLRFSRGSVVVPLRTARGRLVGLQFISGEGAKKFLTGTAKQGAYHLVGEPKPGKRLAVAEGYATVATVHRATGWACAAAFDAGNLEAVCLALREAYPRSALVVCGDDDRHTAGNPGRTKAQRAAESAGGLALFPRFAGDEGTDWNDLQTSVDLDEVKRQLSEALSAAPREAPAPPGGGGGEDFPFDLGILLREYALVYGTETVFDARVGRVIALSGLRAAAGKGLVRIWQEHPDRRLVMPENVVFDPAGEADPARTVNLFRGWPMRPRKGACVKLLELLYYLCGESDNLFDWILKWVAYPLQRPGAKMTTAIIMHGMEGSGKNTWWGVVRRIYGEYGVQITQSEMDSQFNGWASGKLFVIGNEVVSRQELYHHKGRLKTWISEDEWPINEKMLPVRMEGNHANFVFLSNALQPATPDPEDRRYLVVWTPPAMPDAGFYAEASNEGKGDGAAALYYYLLHYALGDFNPHTKPIPTLAKDELIEASMESHERFFRQWKAGELQVAWRPCKSLQLYRAYRRWCDERGERVPAPERIFSSAMAKRMPRRTPEYMEGQRTRQAWCFVPADWKPETSIKCALGAELEQFEIELDAWKNGGEVV